MMRTRALFIFIAALAAVRIAAAPSGSHAEWANGPVRWLMTEDERRAWDALSTDSAASDFIDLFWVQRDPSPGTAANEYKDDFERRADEADKLFSTAGKRGSLTDPGRVYVVLGRPIATVLPDPGPLAARVNRFITFSYDAPASLGLTGRVTFMENRRTHQFEIVPQTGNVFGALDRAVVHAIVNPDMKTLPQWAQRLGAPNQ